MSGTSESTPNPSGIALPRLEELLGRALTDQEFRNRLYDDREQAIKDYKLTPSDLAALDNLPRDVLENAAQRAAQQGAPPIAAIGIGIGIKIHF